MVPMKHQDGYIHTPFPQQLVIEVTAACNQRCIFCGRSYMERPKKTMPRSLFEKIVQEVAHESPYTEIWPAFMGESMLLGNKLFDQIRYAKEIGCQKITLNTNGTRINERTVPHLIECGIDRLIVSCDAHTAATHALVRPKTRSNGEGLEEIYRGVLLLLRTLHKRNLRRPLIEMQFSVFDENEHEAEAFCRFWLDQGAIVKIRPKLHWSGTVADGGSPACSHGRKPCLWALETAAIHWNGNVVMCAVDCEGKYVAGNIEIQTVKEIWNGPLRWIRELHIRHRFNELPEICRKCPDWGVKKARAYFPDTFWEAEYEGYLRQGRIFLQQHYWREAGPALRQSSAALH